MCIVHAGRAALRCEGSKQTLSLQTKCPAHLRKKVRYDEPNWPLSPDQLMIKILICESLLQNLDPTNHYTVLFRLGTNSTRGDEFVTHRKYTHLSDPAAAAESSTSILFSLSLSFFFFFFFSFLVSSSSPSTVLMMSSISSFTCKKPYHIYIILI